MLVWRLQRLKYDPLDGNGARLNGGRWSREGRRVVYTSDTLALAVLEVLVHFDSDLVPDDYAAFAIDIPDELPREQTDGRALPAGWRRAAVCAECVDHGEAWLDRGAAAILQVPSAVVPSGVNVLINPIHPAAERIRVVSAEPFDFDPRLL